MNDRITLAPWPVDFQCADVHDRGRSTVARGQKRSPRKRTLTYFWTTDLLDGKAVTVAVNRKEQKETFSS